MTSRFEADWKRRRAAAWADRLAMAEPADLIGAVYPVSSGHQERLSRIGGELRVECRYVEQYADAWAGEPRRHRWSPWTVIYLLDQTSEGAVRLRPVE